MESKAKSDIVIFDLYVKKLKHEFQTECKMCTQLASFIF